MWKKIRPKKFIRVPHDIPKITQRKKQWRKTNKTKNHRKQFAFAAVQKKQDIEAYNYNWLYDNGACLAYMRECNVSGGRTSKKENPLILTGLKCNVHKKEEAAQKKITSFLRLHHTHASIIIFIEQKCT